MRRLTLCPLDDSDSEYVSLADLRATSRDSSTRLLPGETHGGTTRTDDDDTALVPLTAADTMRLHWIQDVLLVSIVSLSIVLVGWACGQLYRGRVCVTSDSSTALPSTDIARSPRCLAFSDANYLKHGGPNVFLSSQGHPWSALSFEGGWPLAHSLLHVIVPAFIVLGVAIVRTTSSVVHHSLTWIGFLGVELVVVLIDALKLRRWKQTSCVALPSALQTFAAPSSQDQWATHCVTVPYDSFVFVEALLAVALLMLVLLEPVLLRLWCPAGRGGYVVPVDDRGSLHELLEDGQPTPLATYRKL